MNIASYLLVGWLVMVAVFDLRMRRVPNWLQLIGLASALLALLAGMQPVGFTAVQAVVASAAAFCFFLVFYALGLMGAGDVKFAAVLGLWLGLEMLLPVWLIGTVIAGVHALLSVVLQRMPWVLMSLPRAGASVDNTSDADPPRARPAWFSGKRPIPYAAYLSIGGLYVMHSHWHMA